MLSHVTLLVFLKKDYGHFLRKFLNIDLHPGLVLLNARILSGMDFRRIVNVGLHALNDWKNEFLRIIDKEYTNLLNTHICTNRHPVVQSSH